MEIKKIIAIALIAFCTEQAFTQECTELKKALTINNPKFFGYVTTLTVKEIELAISSSRYLHKDQALSILKSGHRNTNFGGAYQKLGIDTAFITLQAFIKLETKGPELNSKEKRIGRKEKRLQLKILKAISKDKPTDKYKKKLNDPEFSKLEEKYTRLVPVLILIGPSYELNGLSLISYAVFQKARDGLMWQCDICTN